MELGTEPTHHVRSLFSPDGKLLAIRQQYAEQTIELRDMPSGKFRLALGIKTGVKDSGIQGLGGKTYTSPVPPLTLVFSSDSTKLATYSTQKTMSVWDITTGQRLASLPDGEPIQSGAFSPDGRCLAVDRRDGTVMVYELAAGQLRRTYGSKIPPKPKKNESTSLLPIPPSKLPFRPSQTRASLFRPTARR